MNPDTLWLITTFFSLLDQRIILKRVCREWEEVVGNGYHIPGSCTGIHTSMHALRWCTCSRFRDLTNYIQTFTDLPQTVSERYIVTQQWLQLLSGTQKHRIATQSIVRSIVQAKPTELVCKSIAMRCIFNLLLSEVKVYYKWADPIQLRLLLFLYNRCSVYNRRPTIEDWQFIYDDTHEWLTHQNAMSSVVAD
jgi:hypothetical protein